LFVKLKVKGIVLQWWKRVGDQHAWKGKKKKSNTRAHESKV